MLFSLCLWVASAWALDGNDRLDLTLGSGEVVSGWYFTAQDGLVVLSGDNRFTEVPVEHVIAWRCNGATQLLVDFEAEMAGAQSVVDAYRLDPPPTPSPMVVGTLAMGLGGAGHAALGDWGQAAGYALVDVVFLGLAAHNLFVAENGAVVLPLLGLDLLFRGYATGEVVREAKRRRARLEPGRDPTPTGVDPDPGHE